LPVVCSPVGANREIVTDGVEGFWAADQEAWMEKLATLAADAELRRALGNRGRDKVLRRYSLQANIPLLLQALRDNE
jgi:glycosyltransferase involved in cell wall biosynthesis